MLSRKDRLKFSTYEYIEHRTFALLAVLPPFCRTIFYRATFHSFGKNVHIGENCYFRYPWKISIGPNVNLGSGCQIFPSFQIKDAKIIIEENVMAAPNLTIFGAGHPIEDPHGSHIAENVYIKQDAYIGGNVTIRYGITVGRSAVIAAGSVVTKDIPDLEVWGGNPAQFIKKIM